VELMSLMRQKENFVCVKHCVGGTGGMMITFN
jgi:hypothetical protein